MRRSQFLKRAGVLVGGLAVAGRLPASVTEAAVTPSAAPAVVDAVTPGFTSDAVLRASGGLCSPLAPYYDLHPGAVLGAAELPMFTAKRGGIKFAGSAK